jgi:eukaryotic-like serine/threonine-protein kinase
VQAADGEVTGNGLPIRFGKYTLIRKLATGGMAELFLAIQKSVAGFEKLVVVKRILPAMNQDRAFIEMLLHEARVAATLSHPNVVQTFDVGSVDGTYFIAMEHVHGEDLRSVVRQMKRKDVVEFPLEHALSIVLGMCAGLAYAHDRRDLDGTPLHIVHRDISPQNVVVTFTGDVKVVDFGIAKSSARVEEVSKDGHLKGKVPYMSPEQARGENIDFRSDVFSVGVMLFELTTGKRLFKGANEYETLKLICDREYPLPSQARMGYPRELEVIVMRALQKDRAQRFQSAQEMQAAIEEFVRAERLGVSTIGLSKFMQDLFEEKLASQKEALLQGKQLADIIALEGGGSDSLGSIDTRNPVSSTGSVARTLAPTRTEKTRGPWLGLTAAASVVALAGVGIWWGTRRSPAEPQPADAPVVELPAMSTTPSASAQAASTPPLGIAVPATADSTSAPATPVAAPAERRPPAAKTADHTAPAVPPTSAGNGKLNVAARGGWCNVSIDGMGRGPTPVAGAVLSVGTHTVTCTLEGGKTLTSTVRVEADATTRFSFVVPSSM